MLAEVRGELVQLLREGHDVVVDHGLWRRQDRDSWRMYFPVPKDELLRRLNSRNSEGHANALPVTAEASDGG